MDTMLSGLIQQEFPAKGTTTETSAVALR